MAVLPRPEAFMAKNSLNCLHQVTVRSFEVSLSKGAAAQLGWDGVTGEVSFAGGFSFKQDLIILLQLIVINAPSDVGGTTPLVEQETFTRLNISVKHMFDMFFPLAIMSHQNPLFKGCMYLAPKPFI